MLHGRDDAGTVAIAEMVTRRQTSAPSIVADHVRSNLLHTSDLSPDRVQHG